MGAAMALMPFLVWAEDVYVSQSMKKGGSLYGILNYSITVGTRDSARWGSKEVVRDGTDVMLYLQSANVKSGYSVCVKYDYIMVDRSRGTRYGCFSWFDKKLHSLVLLTDTEAARLSALVVHNYDIKGSGKDWKGVGDPPNMRSHQKYAYTIKDPPMPTRGVGAHVSNAVDREDEILAFAVCGAMYLSESMCADMFAEEFGDMVSGVSCAAAVQYLSDGEIDPADLLVGAVADAATESDNVWFQLFGAGAKLALFYECYEDNVD